MGLLTVLIIILAPVLIFNIRSFYFRWCHIYWCVQRLFKHGIKRSWQTEKELWLQRPRQANTIMTTKGMHDSLFCTQATDGQLKDQDIRDDINASEMTSTQAMWSSIFSFFSTDSLKYSLRFPHFFFFCCCCKEAQSLYLELFCPCTKLPLNWRKPENISCTCSLLG